jgi:hypothetical protein
MEDATTRALLMLALCTSSAFKQLSRRRFRSNAQTAAFDSIGHRHQLLSCSNKQRTFSQCHQAIRGLRWRSPMRPTEAASVSVNQLPRPRRSIDCASRKRKAYLRFRSRRPRAGVFFGLEFLAGRSGARDGSDAQNFPALTILFLPSESRFIARRGTGA